MDPRAYYSTRPVMVPAEDTYSRRSRTKSNSEAHSLMPRAGGPLKTRTDFDETVEKDLNSDPAKRTVWHIYNEKSEKEDEAFLKGINEAMDVLLIFAGLFSATAAAFLQFTLPLLANNPQNETNQLLLSIFYKLDNASYSLPAPINFIPSSDAFAANCLIFASIAGSLMAAFFAILTKQWVQSIQVGLDTIANQSLRARTRHFRLDGVRGWHFADMAAMLPVLLHASLCLFAIGVVDFLWITGEETLSIIIMVILAIGTAAYFILSVAPLQAPRAPFWSPLTTILDLIRSGLFYIFRRIRSLFLRKQPLDSGDNGNKKIYGEIASVSRRVADDISIDVEVVLSLMNSADKDTETSVLYASLRELQELSLKGEIDPNSFNEPIVFETWSYLAKTCLWNHKPPTLIPGKEDRARFLCQVLEWLGCLTKDPSLKAEFSSILEEGKELSRAVFDEGFKNKSIRDMVIGHLARTTINHMEQVSPHQCRLCIDSDSGRSVAIEEYLITTGPQPRPALRAVGDTLSQRQQEGKWVIAYITAQTRCLTQFSPQEPPSKEARRRVKQLINSFGLGDPKIYDDWRARRWHAPIMRADTSHDHASLWIETIRKARENSRIETKARGDTVNAEMGSPHTYKARSDRNNSLINAYGYPRYHNPSPPHTWSPSSSRTPSPVASNGSHSSRSASPALSFQEKQRSRSHTLHPSFASSSRRARSYLMKQTRPFRGRTRTRLETQEAQSRSVSPDREQDARYPGAVDLASSQSPMHLEGGPYDQSVSPHSPVTRVEIPEKRTRFKSISSSGTHSRMMHVPPSSRPRTGMSRRRSSYGTDTYHPDYTLPTGYTIPPWKLPNTPSEHVCFIQNQENPFEITLDGGPMALFNIYLISESIRHSAVVLSPAPGFQLETLTQFKEVSNQNIEFILSTVVEEDIEIASPSMKYLLRTSNSVPDISDENGLRLPTDEFISHISSVLDRLGVRFQIRQQFIKANMNAFLAHKWILYRFMPPEELTHFVDLSVSLPRCKFTRLFLLFKGISPVDGVSTHKNEEGMLSELIDGLPEDHIGNELFEIGIMDCTPMAVPVLPPGGDLNHMGREETSKSTRMHTSNLPQRNGGYSQRDRRILAPSPQRSTTSSQIRRAMEEDHGDPRVLNIDILEEKAEDWNTRSGRFLLPPSHEGSHPPI